jgi:hypothetical protein
MVRAWATSGLWSPRNSQRISVTPALWQFEGLVRVEQVINKDVQFLLPYLR